MKFKHILLTLSLIELAIGFSNARPNAFFYLGLPVGTILLGLFFIFQLLEKESALFDEQNRTAELARQNRQVQRPPLSVKQEATHHPALTTAHSR